MRHLTTKELEADLETIRQSPEDNGILKLIVWRPRENEREVLEEGELNSIEGLVDDNWKIRASSHTANGSAHPDMQLNIINSRVAALVAREKSRWQLAGDQLYIDLDLSDENLPPGTQLAIGSAIIEVTAQLHTGCRKFVERFGLDTMRFVNSPIGKKLHLRGINAKVVQTGRIQVNDLAKKIKV